MAKRTDEIKRLYKRGLEEQVSTDKSERPLHVMLDSADFDRYKALAQGLKMSLRDFVRMALEAQWQRHHPVPLPPGGHDANEKDRDSWTDEVVGPVVGMPIPPQVTRVQVAHSERLGRLEAWQSSVDRWRDSIEDELDELANAIRFMSQHPGSYPNLKARRRGGR